MRVSRRSSPTTSSSLSAGNSRHGNLRSTRSNCCTTSIGTLASSFRKSTFAGTRGTDMAIMAATIRSIEITIPTDPPTASKSDQAQRRRRKHYGLHRTILVAVALGLGAFLLYLGVPRTVAAWANLDAQPALDKLRE